MIVEQHALEDLIDTLLDEPLYAIDTEFVREKTYYPDLALVQIGYRSGIALIDPLEVDVTALARLFAGPGLAVLHAATADLEVFAHDVGSLPRQLFDTQIAGAFLGHGIASLAQLLKVELGVEISKSEQLGDWKRRPLSDSALAYAAADVAHLLALHERMRRALEKRGRLGWVEEECERQRGRELGQRDPETAWWKLKGRSNLPSRAQGVAQSLAAYREREARRLDVLPRFVLADLPLLAMAQRPPGSLAELERIRGIEPRHLRPASAEAMLAAIRTGLELPREARRLPPRPEAEPPASLVLLCLAWVAQRASDEGIEPSMLASRDEVESFVLDPNAGRLARGFRHALLGADLQRLLRGDLCLRTTPEGKLSTVAPGE